MPATVSTSGDVPPSAPPIDEAGLVPWARRVVRAERVIEAPAERVWALMVDAGGYGEWNPFVVAVDAPEGMGLGAEITLHVRMGGLIGQTSSRERIGRLQAPTAEAWGELAYDYIDSLSLFGMVRGTRWQGVQPLGPQRCRYVTYEGFAGWLWRLLPFGAVERGFEAHAAALARAAESPAGASAG